MPGRPIAPRAPGVTGQRPNRIRLARWLTGACAALILVAALWWLPRTPALRGNGPPAELAITEFMAANNSALLDVDGDASDWIEIHNAGPAAVDLGGWFLTDSRRTLARWRFPHTILAAGDYMIVFASAKDRAVAGEELHASFRLARGEYLALVEADGKTIASEYALRGVEQFSDISYGRDQAGQERHFVTTTPGAVNAAGPEDLGPILSAAGHTPRSPTVDQDIAVTAVVRNGIAPLDAVTLHYRIMYGETVSLPMLDDGAHGDDRPGDGVYGATIPSQATRQGDMVRYYVSARDTAGRTSRMPFYRDPGRTPAYLGTMVVDPEAVHMLPTLYWFTDDPVAAETLTGARASVYYVEAGQSKGDFYDNVFVRLRGWSSRGWPKRCLKFDFNPGYLLRHAAGEMAEEINLNTTYSDKAYIRQTLAWETYRDAGGPYCISFPLSMWRNGAFYSVTAFVEQPDERYMLRNGLDPDGAMYKMHVGSALEPGPQNAVKVTRLYEDDGDLQDLIAGIHLPDAERTAYLFDHVNIPAILNYQAVATLIHDRDQGHNNYYLYRDTEGTGEWTFLPWDKDLTFGLNYNEGLDLNVTADDDPQSHPLNGYKFNDLLDALLEIPATREMFLRRLRTLMDELLQPPGTPPEELRYEQRIDALYTRMQLDVARDAEIWPSKGEPQTFATAIQELRIEYLAARRVHLYETHSAAIGSVIPAAQPPTATVSFGEIGYAPVGERETEYLTLVNEGDAAVDISGWRLVGGVEHTFQPGVVVPSGGTLYLSPDTVVFRTRATSPTGGEGRFVQGPYVGQLSDRGGLVRLYNASGALVAHRFFLDVGPFEGGVAVAGLVLLPLAVGVRRLRQALRRRARRVALPGP